ncbi:hypothetical protein [Streptomyces carpaticus]|uniref:hypothetical protein n=1 Tax=Streptomyces carpaticus TaxID=285558 RepID=UPI0031F7F57C
MRSKLAAAISSGDRRTALEAVRDKLATELGRADGRDAAAVARELRAVLDALDALPGGEVSTLDDLSARREARRADAAGG